MILRKSGGQSLFEVVIALAISALIIVALVALAANSIRDATFARNKTLASKYADETNEWLRGQRDGETDLFFTNTSVTANWCFPTLNWPVSPSGCGDDDVIPGTLFTRRVEFTRGIIGNGKTLVTADTVVSWKDAQGYHEVRSVTDFTDWRQQ